jgi:hypothetical protein
MEGTLVLFCHSIRHQEFVLRKSLAENTAKLDDSDPVRINSIEGPLIDFTVSIHVHPAPSIGIPQVGVIAVLEEEDVKLQTVEVGKVSFLSEPFS